ncbi:hypothetical protein SK128_000805 [Halocaridina rubra]|uniref:Uncharacterized protein n=1 Tax=Halocaridina rubra TaxID=373956 RepID=A0AAN9AHE5_HALRR
MRELPCVICGQKKHQGVYQNYRISECDRANKFLEVTVRFQDEVYIRTCDLQRVSTVFGADLYCHICALIGGCGHKQAKPKVSDTIILHGQKAFNVDLECQKLKQFYRLVKKPDLPAIYQVATDSIPVNSDLLAGVRAKDTAWLLARLGLDTDPLYTVKIRPKNQTVPSWSATNSVCSPDDINRKQIAFLYILPYPITQYDTDYTTLKTL